jgi:hypothetical protein
VKGSRAAVDDLLNKLGKSCASSPLPREAINLLLGGDLASYEEPEKALRKRLLAAGSLGELILNLRDCVVAEPNSLH